MLYVIFGHSGICKLIIPLYPHFSCSFSFRSRGGKSPLGGEKGGGEGRRRETLRSELIYGSVTPVGMLLTVTEVIPLPLPLSDPLAPFPGTC